MIDEFSASLGGRLRAARRQRGWSLGEVESFTEGEFKASVVGAYERGERAISVQRFARLAEIYQVDPANLLPASADSTAVVIDLDRVSDSGDDLVDRYLAAIQLLRREDNPHEVRHSDKALIASLLEANSKAASKS